MPSATTAGQAIWCRRSAMAQRAASCAWLTSVARLPQARRGRYSRTGSYCSHSATDSRFPPQGVTVRRVNCQAVPKHATLLQSPRKFLRLCTHTDGDTSLRPDRSGAAVHRSDVHGSTHTYCALVRRHLTMDSSIRTRIPRAVPRFAVHVMQCNTTAPRTPILLPINELEWF